MPFVRISMRAGKPSAYKQAVMEAVYRALRESFAVPEDDRFVVIDEHAPDAFSYGKSFLDIDRSDDLLMIQITASNTRTQQVKQALFKRICDLLVRDPGLRPQDVFIHLVENVRGNWSFGMGEAQYAIMDATMDIEGTDKGKLPRKFRLAR